MRVYTERPDLIEDFMNSLAFLVDHLFIAPIVSMLYASFQAMPMIAFINSLYENAPDAPETAVDDPYWFNMGGFMPDLTQF